MALKTGVAFEVVAPPLQLLMGGERGPPRESSSDLPLGKGGWVVEREV